MSTVIFKNDKFEVTRSRDDLFGTTILPYYVIRGLSKRSIQVQFFSVFEEVDVVKLEEVFTAAVAAALRKHKRKVYAYYNNENGAIFFTIDEFHNKFKYCADKITQFLKGVTEKINESKVIEFINLPVVHDQINTSKINVV